MEEFLEDELEKQEVIAVNCARLNKDQSIPIQVLVRLDYLKTGVVRVEGVACPGYQGDSCPKNSDRSCYLKSFC